MKSNKISKAKKIFTVIALGIIVIVLTVFSTKTISNNKSLAKVIEQTKEMSLESTTKSVADTTKSVNNTTTKTETRPDGTIVTTETITETITDGSITTTEITKNELSGKISYEIVYVDSTGKKQTASITTDQLLEYVDNSVIKDSEMLKIAKSPAVEISFLTTEEQKCLLDYIEYYQITPSHAQAIKLKEMSQNKTFTKEKMEELLDVEKPNATPMLKVSMNKLKNVLPRTLKNDKEREDYVINAVVFYEKYQQKQKQRQELTR